MLTTMPMKPAYFEIASLESWGVGKNMADPFKKISIENNHSAVNGVMD